MAKVKGEEQVPLSFEIELSRQAYEVFRQKSSEDKPLVPLAAATAKFLLEQYALGGLMLRPNEVQRIEQTIPQCDGPKIIKAVEASSGMVDGQYSFRVQIDPAYFGPAKEIADFRGMELDQLLSEAANAVLENGWYAEIATTGGSIRLTEDQRTELEQILGTKTFHAEDLLTAMRLAKPALELHRMNA